MAKPWIELWLELETRCNLECLFCYNYWKSGDLEEPSRAATAKTIEGLHRLLDAVDCRKIAFSGGEPLLRKDLIELLAAIRPYRVPVVLTTNGVFLTPQKLLTLTSAGIRHFQVPLHSHDPKVHNLLSGVECWDHSLKAILSVQQSACSIVPVFVATKLNMDHFLPVLTICGRLGIKKIIFNRFIPSGAGSLHRNQIGVPNDDELLGTLDAAESAAFELGVAIELGVPIQIPASRSSSWKQISLASCPVHAGQRRWTIGSDLNVRRCNHSAVSIGNLLGDGVSKLLEEVSFITDETDSPLEVRPCQFLKANNLVQIRVC